jgi:hypothetical protein
MVPQGTMRLLKLPNKNPSTCQFGDKHGYITDEPARKSGPAHDACSYAIQDDNGYTAVAKSGEETSPTPQNELVPLPRA